MGTSYEDAGVNISAGEQAVERIKSKVRSTFRPEVIGDIGGFGGLFSFAQHRYTHPVLVSATDGVGTKALIAQATGRFDTIGVDLVAMCVDDIVCQGAEPLFFLDYIAVGKLDPDHIEQLVEGVAHGCRQAGCALVGGEMAEHPGAMEPGEFDLVGFAVGVAERDRLITGQHVRTGDVLIALPSPGLRSNGYSLARKVLLDSGARSLDDPAWAGAHHTLADELLLPSVIYAPAIAALLRVVDVRAIAHITGGGLPGNLNRVLPEGTDAVVDARSWEPPRIFGEIQAVGDVADAEMFRVFNMGIGMVVVVPAGDAHRTIDVLRTEGHRAAEIGAIQGGTGQVRIG
jgi:phosphoribosylformylglycinamidine cyclo-ligase